jgi:hypothetical protein
VCGEKKKPIVEGREGREVFKSLVFFAFFASFDDEDLPALLMNDEPGYLGERKRMVTEQIVRGGG